MDSGEAGTVARVGVKCGVDAVGCCGCGCGCGCGSVGVGVGVGDDRKAGCGESWPKRSARPARSAAHSCACEWDWLTWAFRPLIWFYCRRGGGSWNTRVRWGMESFGAR